MPKPKKKVAQSGSNHNTTANKNPLSQALGIVLRKMRVVLHPEPDFIAKAINVQASYYRAVEAGTYNLHISNALKLYEAFSGIFSYEAIQKILSTISIIEVSTKEDTTENGTNYYKSLSNVFKKISEHDDRIKLLYEKFSENDFLNKIENLTHDQVSKAISENKLDLVLENFLTQYKTFSKTPIEIQNLYAVNYFKIIPTNQMEIFDKIKEYAINQPTEYTSVTSWNWEKNNSSFFKTCFILDNQPEIITGLKNLTNYRYDYLWQTNFDKTFILFISEESSTKYKDLFKKNLKKSLETLSKKDDKDGIDAKEKLKTLDKIINEKVEIKCISAPEDKVLAAKILKPTNNTLYNAAWVFSLTNFFNVGVRAILEGDDARLTKGDYLTFDDTLTTLKDLIDLWKKV